MPEPTSPIPTIQRKDIPPPGILPKNTQIWIIAGLALLMVLVIAFSGSREPKEHGTPAPVLRPTVDPDEARIQDYRARIEEQARKLQAEQAQLVQTRQAMGLAANAPATPGAAAYPVSNPPSYHGETAMIRPENPIEGDREKREYESLFASNVALTLRAESKPEPPPVAAIGISTAPTPGETARGAGNIGTDQDSAKSKSRERDAPLDRFEGLKYRIFEGTVIETVLTNRLDGSFSGPVNCQVTTNVYSRDSQRLLIPQGSRVLGEVKRVDAFGQERLAVVFHRLIMPDGYSVSLDQLHGLNQIGETGLRDQVNHHYAEVFGAAIAVGAIAGLSQANTQYGANETAADAYRQGVASSVSQSSLRILDRYLNVLPTFTIREGNRVKVYLSQDLLLPPYEKHEMPSDL